ncbi:DctP family TRAP transporter solute-binding subunit [candidate division KSB3 bacterium]|uniref:DctP family TRAP transporter solute-binding subunit n=1 Tax=candidate division KSB3 bacterium TaxID=2044937 RepID=A0A9D5Q598_9BACT|nr:DctP family TRAP transporter solute-binding subunit [candidate division KSB3 bacterium]MBD3324599.1 DctP family TRAP transporter solute-binding subunit [candidate division KSB3 bacterium]
MKKLIGVGLVFVLCVALWAVPASAAQVVKIAHIDPADPFMSADHSCAVVFKSMVESGTNGEIEVNVFPSSVLGSSRDLMAMLKAGQIQIFLSSVGGIGTFFPEIGVLDTPFAIPNMSVAWEVFDGWFGDELKEKILEKTGIRCLEILDQGGFFHFTNNKRPITSLEDMKGIKFRTMTLPSHIAFFRSMGASAIPISWSEVYTSLQTGVADGQHNPFAPILGSKLYEVQEYLTLSGHIWSTHWFLVNDEWYQSLTDEQKLVVRNAANVGKVAGRGITKIYESSEKGIPLVSKSMEINALSPTDKAEFAAVTIPAMKEWVKENLGEEGVALQEDFLKAIEEARDKLGY